MSSPPAPPARPVRQSARARGGNVLAWKFLEDILTLPKKGKKSQGKKRQPVTLVAKILHNYLNAWEECKGTFTCI